MATMIKEKRREKKTPKEKQVLRSVSERSDNEQPSVSVSQKLTEDFKLSFKNINTRTERSTERAVSTDDCNLEQIDDICTQIPNVCLENNSLEIQCQPSGYSDSKTACTILKVDAKAKLFEPSQAYSDQTIKESTLCSLHDIIKKTMEHHENTVPSAPVFDEEMLKCEPQKVTTVKVVTKVCCMPLEEAIRLYGGAEMAEVRALSEKQEALVEAGAISGPEHPLVDLLSTFRCSVTAVERECTQLANGFIEEEKARSSLWKVEKRTAHAKERCSCGSYVTLKGTYEHAELQRDKLPLAKIRLESLLRDVQESYCHYQHGALLAHFQIDELISETVESNKSCIREALSLLLQELRLSDSAPGAFAAALQRWVTLLSAALMRGQDLRHLLFLLHHLFRQTRSVRWAASAIELSVGDSAGAARTIALLELLLARPGLEPAQECTEEAWEEVDRHGSGSAVSEGALRERDLLALLHTFPLRELVARIVLFTHSDIGRASDQQWGDRSGGRGVLKACCGARALLATLQRATRAHAHYTRLLAELRALATHLLHALAALHNHSQAWYSKELEKKVYLELEASFAAGFTLLAALDLHELPATLLSDSVAKDYCVALIVGLHDKSPKQLSSLSVELPAVPCAARVRMVAQAAADRTCDPELARIVLDFLFQTAIKRQSVACKGACEAAARKGLPLLFDAHPDLQTAALHTLAELSRTIVLDADSVKPLAVHKWRPGAAEARAVLDVWAERCPQLIQHLLLDMDYTPHTGVALETQLALGWWLWSWLRAASPPAALEWAWHVLRRLRAHRAWWRLPLDAAPAPMSGATDLFANAYALLATSWGHSIPQICSHGVPALCGVAAVRARDAVHCLAPVMLVMAGSPESVSLTPQFQEVMSSLLGSGPTLVQRALGRGPAPGSELLLRLMLTQLDRNQSVQVGRKALVSAWLHALWRPSLPGAYPLLEAALLASREWTQFDYHANMFLHEKSSKEHVSAAMRGAAQAPLVCECVLRNAHAQLEARTHVWPRLLAALHQQRTANERTHVDNALKLIGITWSAEELVIYKTASAVLAAPMEHPAHLTLWRLLLHLYLQRPGTNQDSPKPVGPIIFSGLVKMRTLSQLRRRLQDTAAYHHLEAEKLKAQSLDEVSPKSSTANAVRKSGSTIDKLLPALSIVDFTGESSESESDSSDDEKEVKNEAGTEQGVAKDVVTQMICYHSSAHKMMCKYQQWLEEGEKVSAWPHDADIARFVPEQALEAAWVGELSRRRPPAPADADEFPLPSDTPPPTPAPPVTPFHTVTNRILAIRDHSRKRARKPRMKSRTDDVDFNDMRSLLCAVDKHLNTMERLAQEWSSEVSRISSLDGKLWELVSALRVRRAVPPVRKACANKCEPLTIALKVHEWCISTGAEQEIRDNRSSARAALRRLARPRPHAAQTAGALHSTARRVLGAEAAVRIVESAWRSAARVERCAPVCAALTALVEQLAKRWMCHDGRLVAQTLSRWGERGEGALQQALCGALVAPDQAPNADWPLLYTAVLNANLPSHAVFSYLSKFKLRGWCESADPAQRRALLEALSLAAQRWGIAPHPDHHVLLELLGVHTCVLTSAPELCAQVLRCTRASVALALPPSYWEHVTRATDHAAHYIVFDQLGNLLRELGAVWWEARAQAGRAAHAHGVYAPHVARLLRTLQHAFFAAAVGLSYAPERVAWYAWSALQESWAPWVSPVPTAPPLLPSTATEELYTPMLAQFVDTVRQIMLECPGSEDYLLQQMFEWTVHTYLSVQSVEGAPQECRVQASALLSVLATLDWTRHQWFRAVCLPAALRVCESDDKEISAWCADAWRGVTAETWVRGAAQEELASRLAALLHLFTGMPHSDQTLEEATRLPWWYLPESALEQALGQFFARYHSASQPYHDVPQFRVLLFASELCVPAGVPAALVLSETARLKRACAVSLWVRAACEPALKAHVPKHAAKLLAVITDIAPFLEQLEGDLEKLLGRAAVMLCVQPCAGAALPVWRRWVSRASPALCLAALSAASVLTTFDTFAELSDAVARAHLQHNGESSGWAEVSRRWASCPWTEAGPLAARARPHAAYGVARTHPQPYAALRTAFLALLATKLHFVDNEVIIAVWICFACRAARECAGDAGGARSGGGERAECVAAGLALLLRWAEEPRLNILKVVTMQTDPHSPTAKHRLLCRFAQCVLTPGSESAVRAYEAACSAVLGSSPGDAITWGKAPLPKRLPRLAMRLYPNCDGYFLEELNSVPEDT